MAIRKQAEVLWKAFTKGDPPRTISEMVDLLGGATEAAGAVGVHPSTVNRWQRKERESMPSSVEKMIDTLGGTKQAAKAAGVKPRTIRAWRRQEERGTEPGPRQAKRIEQLQDAALDKYAAEKRPEGNVDKLQDAALSSPQARQQAVSSRRTSRIAKSGARLVINAKVIIKTGERTDERWRNIDINMKGDGLAEPVQEWLNGGNDDAVKAKLNESFGRDYAPGTDWRFGEIRSMDIRGHGGTGGTFFRQE